MTIDKKYNKQSFSICVESIKNNGAVTNSIAGNNSHPEMKTQERKVNETSLDEKPGTEEILESMATKGNVDL